MLTDFGDLFGGEVGVDDVDDLISPPRAAGNHAPGFRDGVLGVGNGMLGVGVGLFGGFVFEEAFAHEDEGEDEAEADFLRFFFVFHAGEDVEEDGVVDEEFLFLFRHGDGGLPEAEHGERIGRAFPCGPAGFAEIDTDERGLLDFFLGLFGFGFGFFRGFLGGGELFERTIAEGGPAFGAGRKLDIAGMAAGADASDVPRG